MKHLLLLALFAFPLGSLGTDDPPAGPQRWDSSYFSGLQRTLSAAAASDPHHAASVKFGDFPNDAIYEIVRTGDGAPELHETEADIYYIQSGSGTLLVGGSLVGASTVAPHELRNGTIQNGARFKLAAGDVLRIPANQPHQVFLDGAREITYLVVKSKGY